MIEGYIIECILLYFSIILLCLLKFLLKIIVSMERSWMRFFEAICKTFMTMNTLLQLCWSILYVVDSTKL